MAETAAPAGRRLWPFGGRGGTAADAGPRAMRQPASLRLASAGFLTFWCLLAAFPLFWILVMSFKSPVDAFSPRPADVVLGPVTRARGTACRSSESSWASCCCGPRHGWRGGRSPAWCRA